MVVKRRKSFRGNVDRGATRSRMSYLFYLIFIAVFGFILLTKFMTFELYSPSTTLTRPKYEWRSWEQENRITTVEVTEAPPPARVPMDGAWQPVSGTRYKFFVFSAFMERRTVAAVRIIAVTKTRNTEPIVCLLNFNNHTYTLNARVTAIRENWNWEFSATFILCLLHDVGVKPEQTIGATIAVSSVRSAHKPPANLLIVRDTRPRSDIMDNIHVCVKPFHFNYFRQDWLIEWFEMNRILGVNYFYMYNKSIDTSVSCIINHYQKLGLVNMLEWKLPIEKNKIRTVGQFATFNDCLYRAMPNASWLIVMDTDELILPRRERKLPSLFNSLAFSDMKRGTPAAFMFRNAFFYTLWEDDPKPPAPLLTARKTRRWAIPHAYKVRSKYAVQPSQAVELGNHFIWQMVPKAVTIGVEIDRALLHHYREVCEFGGTQCLHQASVVDRMAHRWTEQLQTRVNLIKKKLQGTCSFS